MIIFKVITLCLDLNQNRIKNQRYYINEQHMITLSPFVLVSGYWSLASGIWSLVAGCWIVVSDFWVIRLIAFFLIVGISMILFFHFLRMINPQICQKSSFSVIPSRIAVRDDGRLTVS